MKRNNGGIWIDYEFKIEYQDSSKKGLRVIYSKSVHIAISTIIGIIITVVALAATINDIYQITNG